MDNSKIFNRTLLKKRRERSAGHWIDYNFLKMEAAERLVDCLCDVKRDFCLALDLGCHQKELAGILQGKTEVISTDIAWNMQPDIVCDEELLPFANDRFDLVTSVLSLHHVNDLVGSLIQIRHILKPDGLFMAVIFGAGTLMELRHCVAAVSAEYGFPLSPRVSPFAEVRDAGGLLQRAGFALPVISSETVTVEYESAFKLMQDLKGQGESNVLREQGKNFTTRSHLAAICRYYETHFRNREGLIPASFEFITLTAWKPHISQQTPAKKGSGQVNLNEIFG